jgi:hypothetical protein
MAGSARMWSSERTLSGKLGRSGYNRAVFEYLVCDIVGSARGKIYYHTLSHATSERKSD